MCIVHSNHCNVIVGVFICSVRFLPFYLLVMSSVALPLTMHRGAQLHRGAPVGKHCSLTNNIFTNNIHRLHTNCILQHKLSDHQAMICILKKSYPNEKK